MFVKCKSNDGFEDQLTAESRYRVKQLGENSYQILNDRGESRWYGRQHFDLETVDL